MPGRPKQEEAMNTIPVSRVPRRTARTKCVAEATHTKRVASRIRDLAVGSNRATTDPKEVI
jgi:hypothetical protein